MTSYLIWAALALVLAVGGLVAALLWRRARRKRAFRPVDPTDPRYPAWKRQRLQEKVVTSGIAPITVDSLSFEDMEQLVDLQDARLDAMLEQCEPADEDERDLLEAFEKEMGLMPRDGDKD